MDHQKTQRKDDRRGELLDLVMQLDNDRLLQAIELVEELIDANERRPERPVLRLIVGGRDG